MFVVSVCPTAKQKQNTLKIIGSFVVTWMDLESVIQSDVNQKEKNQMHIYYLYGI